MSNGDTEKSEDDGEEIAGSHKCRLEYLKEEHPDSVAEVYRHIIWSDETTTPEIAETTGRVSHQTAQTAIQTLEELGFVETEGGDGKSTKIVSDSEPNNRPVDTGGERDE